MRLRSLVVLVALVALPGTLAAATVLPPTPPPPDLAHLVPFHRAVRVWSDPKPTAQILDEDAALIPNK